ncbi:hypothetical protein ACFL0M_11020 [Thermodesulfobacteriota bacterium]
MGGGLPLPQSAVGSNHHRLSEVRNVVKKDFYFEDMDRFTQDIIIDLVVSILENKNQQAVEQEEHHEESSDICKVE